MPLMNVRFVITGACFVSYSGRQIHLEIPVAQPDGARTTVADVESQVRRNWPAELSDMADAIKTIDMKILKTGRLLKDEDIFEEQLTQAERSECKAVNDAGKTAEEIEKSAVLMHLVFQKEQRPSPAPVTPNTNKGTKASQDDRAQSNGGTTASNNGNGDGRDVKGDNCCTVM